MIFHENRLLLADDSHVISYLIFGENLEKCHKICRLLQIIGGALRVKTLFLCSQRKQMSLTTSANTL